MTQDEFNRVVNNATVRLVNRGKGGLLVEGVTQVELAEIVSMAGEKLGVWKEGTRVNPEWLGLGQDKNVHFIFHREAAK